MGAIPAPINPALDTIDNIIRALVYSVGVAAAIASATVKSPWLGLPIIRIIFRNFVMSIGSDIFVSLKPFVDMHVIKFQNAAHQAAYDSAVKALEKAHQTGDPGELKKASDKFKSDFDKLVTLAG